MALSAKLHVRQAQALVITPQLMQAIRLLQMSGVELERYVAAEIEQNPLLEENDVAAPAAEEAAFEPAAEPSAEEAAGVSDAIVDLAVETDTGDGILTSGSPGPSAKTASSGGADLGLLDLNIAAGESAFARLEREIEALFRDPADLMVARALLDALDPAGYLEDGVEALAARLGAPASHVEEVLVRCQRLEPAGIFARNLGECLALQLAERNRLDPAMRALLDNLPLLAERKFSALGQVCGVDMADIREMAAEIRALDPKPLLTGEQEPVAVRIPDVHVRAGPDGAWIVELNEDVLPRLLVNRRYHALVSARADADCKRYLVDCLQKASWLEKSLDQRARTILKVASEIVRRQEGFLTHGVSRLRPLNLRMVADSVGLHESTVSRATANKTLQTPRGLFEMKYFFSSSIPAMSGGDMHSAEAVKHRIRTFIMNEAPDGVLSDDALVALLGRDGIDIARRTVAKYREMMRIGSSVERRRQRRLLEAS
jgi:RNA polymerase sigma-54 factor